VKACRSLPQACGRPKKASNQPKIRCEARGCAVRVSSVLNREVKQFGKKYMFDGNEETSWNSDQGATQWLTMEFPQTVQASQIQIQFQGGFASRKFILQGGQKGEALSTVAEFYPEDNNSPQISFTN
ncbi:hypothetical protein E2320_021941, partial [Naja naja]